MNNDSLRIAKGSVVCAEADLRGDVTIGNSTIIHPKVRIFAYGGPIVIGEGCLIEEQTVIINRGDMSDEDLAKFLKETETRPPQTRGGRNAPLRSLQVQTNYVCGKQEGETLCIGSYNVFEVGTHVESLKIGSNNVFESKCKLGRDMTVGDGCVVSVFCVLDKEDHLDNMTVVYGPGNQRRKQQDKPMPQTQQLEFLAKVLPNFHNLKKSNVQNVSNTQNLSARNESAD
ncbi:dynactin subunit 6-like [Bolinopsis microptera]|uniref:dynactin subunit 6-like n=1 Tax=Bolinopsis microptera TaxID=2820187 RepID=UPI003078D69E